MRYRIGESPQEQQLAQLDHGIFVAAAVLGLALGIILTTLGFTGRQLWLKVWGSGLVAASIVYLGAALTGMV